MRLTRWLLARAGEPVTGEAGICEGWSWFKWADALPESLAPSLAVVRAQKELDPFATRATFADDEFLPPCESTPVLDIDHLALSPRA